MIVAYWTGIFLIAFAVLINVSTLCKNHLTSREIFVNGLGFLINCFILFLLISAARGGA